LGLSIVYGIVKQHRGCVTVSSQVGVGTTFEIFLPIHAGEAHAFEVPQQNAVMAA
jgi:two-component system, cell cycle sensor histidine kinase and response regulator CckA